jgi:energy-coupling factor transporter ATP-binding protein EcfA2
MRQESNRMYKGYRANITENIAKFVKTGECFRISGKSGVGKSRYLQYLSGIVQTEQDLFDKDISIFYIDLNRIYERTKNNLYQEITNVLQIKPETYEGLVKYLDKNLKGEKIIYLIIDHAHNLQEFEAGTIRSLRSLRDKYKYHFSYILSYQAGIEIDTKRLEKLLEVSPVEIEITNLSPEETKENIMFYAKQMDLDISKDEIEKMVDASGGYPRHIKQLLSHKLAGVDIDKAIINIQNLNTGLGKNEDYFLQKALKSMTKAEFMFFEELYHDKDKVITRDKFAAILSPESNGEGVSNEAIDQVISRLRKKLEELKFPFKVHTQRGVGYYME